MDLTNLRTVQFAFSDTTSAQYYLMVKNTITQSKYPPKYLILLFLNNMLTAPDMFVEGRDFVEQLDDETTDMQ